MRGLEPPPNNGLESKPSAYTKFRHICLFYAPIAAVPTERSRGVEDMLCNGPSRPLVAA
jgi:hypothetical protein